jgi:hypothetical protein
MSSKSPSSRAWGLPPDEDTRPTPLWRFVARELCEKAESDIAGEAAGRSIDMPARERVPETVAGLEHGNKEREGNGNGARSFGVYVQVPCFLGPANFQRD